MEQKTNKQLIDKIAELWNKGDSTMAIAFIIDAVSNLNDKQERVEKYIKMKYPKVYKEVYGEENK